MMMRLTADRLEEIHHAVNCAVFRAMDETLTEMTGVERNYWIRDKYLPRLIPVIEAATTLALADGLREAGVQP